MTYEYAIERFKIIKDEKIRTTLHLQELDNKEKQKEAETDKRNKLFLLSGIVAFVIVCVIAITVGSINEKIHPEPQTTTGFIETATIANTDKLITETTKKETTEKTTKETTEKTTKETTESHYHLEGCRYANGAKMTVAEAERKGWEPCAVCNP